MKAKNWTEFLKSFAKWSSPGLAFSYADVMNNIGLTPQGAIPKRGSENIPMIASPAWKKNCHWSGFYKINSLGYIYNPKKKFIISANNPIRRGEALYTSYLWATPSRAKRIEEILLGGEFYTARDAQYMQNDFLSVYAREQFIKLIYFRKIQTFRKMNQKHIHFVNWDL